MRRSAADSLRACRLPAGARNVGVLLEASDLLENGKPSQAIARLVEAGSNRLRQEARKDANHAWFLVGESSFAQGEFRSALTAYRRAIRSDPTDYIALWAAADCSFELGRSARALCDYQRANAEAPQRSKAALGYNIANSYFDLGDFERSVAEFEQIRGATRSLRVKINKNLNLARAQMKF